ncbi:hypothetical protein [Steroidobacter cummioxidans]|uniref:hypothetical protein n=1 Tax=Steroidobacter cummioxidans TaxID=1803913 RepID=UPI000E31C9E2|nr:hypothetical protein [Steroidobacter cummioxidans]
MSNSPKRFELAEQIELARQGIDRWPGWLKDAAGVDETEQPESTSTREAASTPSKIAIPDPLD